MKGMLTKAFSLALLISVVPSFAALPVNQMAEEVFASPDAALMARSAADDILAATSTAATLKNAAVSGVASIAVPSIWEQVKAYASNARSYVANSRVAGYANSAAYLAAGYTHSALVAPFNYTVGALANQSVLANRVSNIGFVKNDSYYSTTIGKYAFGLATIYAAYKAVQYLITPATKKAEAASQSIAIKAKANPVVTPATKAVVAAKSAFISKEHEEVVKACEAVMDKVLSNKTFVTDSQEMLALGKLPFMQTLIPNSKNQSYATLFLGHTAGIDFARRNNDKADYVKRVQAFTALSENLKKNTGIYYAQAARTAVK